MDKLIVLLDTSTRPTASTADLTTELGSFWIEAATDCVLSVMGWLVSNVDTRILICTYKFMTANKNLPSLRIFVSRNPVVPRNPV